MARFKTSHCLALARREEGRTVMWGALGATRYKDGAPGPLFFSWGEPWPPIFIWGPRAPQMRGQGPPCMGPQGPPEPWATLGPGPYRALSGALFPLSILRTRTEHEHGHICSCSVNSVRAQSCFRVPHAFRDDPRRLVRITFAMYAEAQFCFCAMRLRAARLYIVVFGNITCGNDLGFGARCLETF